MVDEVKQNLDSAQKNAAAAVDSAGKAASDVAAAGKAAAAPVVDAAKAKADELLKNGEEAKKTASEAAGGVAGFLGNNTGLLFGVIVAALSLFGVEGGIMSFLFAGAALIAGYAADAKNPNSIINSIGNMFNTDKPKEGLKLGIGNGQQAPAQTPAPPQPATAPAAAPAVVTAATAADVNTGKVPVPTSKDRVVFRVDNDGKVTQATEGQGLIQIEAFAGDKPGEVVVGYVAATGASGKFEITDDGSKDKITMLPVDKKITLPVKDGYIDVGSQEFQKSLAELREAAKGSQEVVATPVPSRSIVVTDLPLSQVKLSEKTMLSEFIINGENKAITKPEAGAMKIYATRDGTVVSVALAGKDGKFADDGKGSIATIPIGNVTIPVKDSKIDLNDDAVKGVLSTVRRIANPDGYNIVPLSGDKAIVFMVDNNGKKTEKTEAGTMQIIANKDGKIIGFSIADQTGKFPVGTDGKQTLIPITALRVPGVSIGPTKLPITNGYIDLDTKPIKDVLQHLRNGANELRRPGTSAVPPDNNLALGELPAQFLAAAAKEERSNTLG